MAFWNLFQKTDINAGVEEYQKTPGAVLLDVRTDEEVASGKIPGAVHLCLDQIRRVGDLIPDKNTPVFSYCLSGMRSSRAVDAMKAMGYVNVKNIGGISGYKGTLER